MAKKLKVKSFEEKSSPAVTGVTDTNQEGKHLSRKDTVEGLPAGAAVPFGYWMSFRRNVIPKDIPRHIREYRGIPRRICYLGIPPGTGTTLRGLCVYGAPPAICCFLVSSATPLRAISTCLVKQVTVYKAECTDRMNKRSEAKLKN